MAPLPTADTDRIWRGLMRWWSSVAHNESLSGMNKNDINAAVVATDQWIDANQSSFNTVLPITFRTNATTAQKTLMFCAVALMRVGVELLKDVFGEVN